MDSWIEIPLDEWEAAQRLLPLITVDERAPLGQVRLTSNGSSRYWTATDSVRAAVIPGGADTSDYSIGISPNIVRFSTIAGGTADGARLVAREANGQQQFGVTGPGGSLWLDDMGHDFPDVLRSVPADDRIEGRATVVAREFHQLLHAAQEYREVNEDDPAYFPAEFWLGVKDGAVRVNVFWPNCGGTFYELVAGDCTGQVAVRINPSYLRSLIELFGPTDELQLRIPRFVSEPITLSNGETTALLMPIQQESEILRAKVESLIKEVCGPLAVIRDDDDDYPLQRRSTHLFARILFDADPATLQVFAVVLHSIEPTPDVLAELNDLNANMTYARLFHVDGQVLAEVDLAAETLDAHELRTAIRRIREVAEDIIPTLSAVHGGAIFEDPAAVRLSQYRAAIIEAEVTPGRMTAINGPEAPAAWPFPGPVHVITGWNPQGVALSDSVQQDINLRIAEDIVRYHGRFVHGQGRSPDGEHTEPSLIAWGIDRDDAVTMGQRANQDSIFEIDESEVRLISCVDSQIEAWPRLS